MSSTAVNLFSPASFGLIKRSGEYSYCIKIIHNYVCNYYTDVCTFVVKIPIEFQKQIVKKKQSSSQTSDLNNSGKQLCLY